MTYTARSGSRVNEEDDDTGLGEFRDGGRVFNSFDLVRTTRSYFFFFERLFSKERGLFEVYGYCETLFISRREKLKWRISCFLIDVENIF